MIAFGMYRGTKIETLLVSTTWPAISAAAIGLFAGQPFLTR
jgi:hypothetical protein